MEYETLGLEEKTALINNRIAQLEQEHYNIELLLLECEVVGDVQNKNNFTAQSGGLKLRLDKLRQHKQDLEPPSDSE